MAEPPLVEYAMEDEKGKLVTKSNYSVTILGLKDIPNNGDNLLATDDEKLTKEAG